MAPLLARVSATIVQRPGASLVAPTSASEVLSLLREVQAGGQTLVLVTHDARVAAAADRVVSLRDGLVVDEAVLTDRDGSAVLAGLLRLEA